MKIWRPCALAPLALPQSWHYYLSECACYNSYHETQTTETSFGLGNKLWIQLSVWRLHGFGSNHQNVREEGNKILEAKEGC